MPFFDNLGKKASAVTAKAMQKAQELSETSRLNALISDEEARINNAYFQIGKLYVSLHAADREEAFAGMVTDITDAEQKIADYRHQIQELKGVQRCEKCGAEVMRGVAFCSACGAPMPKVEAPVPEDFIICEHCGATVKKGMRFCTACGKPTAPSQAPAVEAAPAAPAAEAAPPVVADKKICPNCGTEMDSDTIFCKECGAKL